MFIGAVGRCWIERLLGEEQIDEVSDKNDNRLFSGGAVDWLFKI